MPTTSSAPALLHGCIGFEFELWSSKYWPFNVFMSAIWRCNVQVDKAFRICLLKINSTSKGVASGISAWNILPSEDFSKMRLRFAGLNAVPRTPLGLDFLIELGDLKCWNLLMRLQIHKQNILTFFVASNIWDLSEHSIGRSLLNSALSFALNFYFFHT